MMFPRNPKSRYRPSGGPKQAEHGLKLMSYTYVNWNQAAPLDWSTSALSSGHFVRGANYGLWHNYFAQRGLTFQIETDATPHNGIAHVYEFVTGGLPEVRFFGAGMIHWAAAFDYTMLGHNPPLDLIREIKRVSRVGTKIGIGLLNFESINQRPALGPLDEQLRLVSRVSPLTADLAGDCSAAGLSAYGCTSIDKASNSDVTGGVHSCAGAPTYLANSVACPHTPAHAGLPANASAGGPHYWDCDVRSPAYVQALAAATKQQLDARYTTTGIDFIIFDNQNDAYKGFALNNFPTNYANVGYRGTRHTEVSQRTGWKGFNQHLQETFSDRKDDFLWSNSGRSDEQSYTAQDVKNRFAEFAFAQYGGTSTPATLAEMTTKLTAAKQFNLRFVLNVQGNQPASITNWATVNGGPTGAQGTWTDISAIVSSLNAYENVMVMAARDSMPDFIYWQPGFRRLV